MKPLFSSTLKACDINFHSLLQVQHMHVWHLKLEPFCVVKLDTMCPLSFLLYIVMCVPICIGKL